MLLIRYQARRQGQPKFFVVASAPGPIQGQVLRAAFVRPFKMFFRSPMVPLLGVYTTVFTSYLNILFATLGTVFEQVYGFTSGQSGLAYLGMALGFIIGLLSIGYYSDWYVLRMERKHGARKPAYRLPPLILGSLMLPAGFIWYGWPIEYHVHWLTSIFGSGLIAVGAMYSYMPVQMYLVDVFTIYAASAVGAVTIFRSALTTVIPLAANPLYDRLGYGWGNTLLAFIAFMFVPFAILLFRYEERIRTNPRFRPRL